MKIDFGKYFNIFVYFGFPVVMVSQVLLEKYTDLEFAYTFETMALLLYLQVLLSTYYIFLKKKHYSGNIEITEREDEGLIFCMDLYESPQEIMKKDEVHFWITVFPLAKSQNKHGL
jgi:hypothetical protein